MIFHKIYQHQTMPLRVQMFKNKKIYIFSSYHIFHIRILLFVYNTICYVFLLVHFIVLCGAPHTKYESENYAYAFIMIHPSYVMCAGFIYLIYLK